MKTDHIPEPWSQWPQEPRSIVDANGRAVASVLPRNAFERSRSQASAARIVSCVNALAGVRDPEAQVAAWRELEGFARQALDTRDAFECHTILSKARSALAALESE